MPYRPPLVPHETFVADPLDLPVRPPGQQGLCALTSATVLAADAGVVTLKALTGDGQTLVADVRAAADGVVRVRLSHEPDAHTRSARAVTMVRSTGYRDGHAEVADGRVRLVAGPLVVEIALNPWHLRFLDETGRLLVEESPGETDVTGRVRTLPLGCSEVDGAVVAYHESFTTPADEHFVGLGEKFTNFDKRGQRAVMWNYDAHGAESDRAYKNIPFYLSSRGYGVLVDSGTAVEFDLCQSTHSGVQIIVPDDLIDYYVIAGPTPAEILDRYDQLTGRPTLPPKWAFGAWISSGFLQDCQERVLDRARRIRREAIPADVLHLDCYWQVAGHWSDQHWDTDAFPDPAAMLATLAEMGFRTCLWINPYVSQLSPCFASAAEKGYFLRHRDGSCYIADVWHGYQPPCGIVDFTNPEATAWFQALLRPLLRQGVAVFKTDFAEGVPADAVTGGGMPGTDLHNVYSLLYNDAVAQVTREIAGHGTVWARSSYLGGQRHSAQWSGDTNTSFPAMASTLRGGLSHGLSGVPFWSHDAGGFTGTPSPDLYVRWTQFGALSPLLRLHGTTSRLPWDFPDEAARDAVDAIRLRYRLMPYLYSAAVTSAHTGLPMLRALLVGWPDDPAAWQADLEYTIGDDLLVAPMTDPDGHRQVYLPAGTWIDWWTGTVHIGRRYLPVTAPLSRVPLFVRHGALIPLAPPALTVGDGPFQDLTLHSFGGCDSRSVIRDVDGGTELRGIREGDVFELRTAGPARIRRVSFARVGGPSAPARVRLDDAEAEVHDIDGVPTAEF